MHRSSFRDLVAYPEILNDLPDITFVAEVEVWTWNQNF